MDESTVHWKETPENDKEVKFLDKNLRSIALTDIILPEKIYVKGLWSRLLILDGMMNQFFPSKKLLHKI